MPSPIANLTAEVNQTIATEQNAVSDIASLTPVTIAVINESTVLTDSAVQTAMAALQIQVVRDFAPGWGCVARLVSFGKDSTIPLAYWQMAILDDSDQADALGYHDVTASGQPLGKVFAKTTTADGLNWTVTFSHELLEILRDPFINIACEVDNAAGVPTTFYSAEVCDACEDDQFAYRINGVLVSDFVLPSWFMPGIAGPYDFMNHVTAPFQLLAGGYISVLDVTTRNGWQQLQAEKAPAHPNTRSNRRLELRRKPKSQWVRSKR
jgi:hypothetical protein